MKETVLYTHNKRKVLVGDYQDFVRITGLPGDHLTQVDMTDKAVLPIDVANCVEVEQCRVLPMYWPRPEGGQYDVEYVALDNTLEALVNAKARQLAAPEVEECRRAKSRYGQAKKQLTEQGLWTRLKWVFTGVKL